MSCPNCRCHKCKSYYRNPAPWGASAWASHMDAPPVANEGPATSLETSMTEHFLGPMRNPDFRHRRGPDTSDEIILRLHREYVMAPTQELYERLTQVIARTEKPAEYFFKGGLQPPPRRNPWDPLEARIKKLCLYSDLSAAEISEYMNIPFSWAAEACRTHRQEYSY